MDYVIREVSLEDPTIRLGIDRVVGRAFGSGREGASICDDIQKVTQSRGMHSSLHLAAMLGDELIGFNAFISHDMIYQNQLINCYQSCFTATSQEHRGKKIFQNLIISAHDILGARGAAFVFGFPNENSYPIFTEKLNYRELPSMKVTAFNIPLYRNTIFQANHPTLSVLHEHAVRQNDKQLIEMKLLKYGTNLIVAEFEESTAWALRRSTIRSGVSVPYLDIGGVDLKSTDHLASLIGQLRTKADWVSYIQFVTIAGNTYNNLFCNLKNAKTNCFIVYDLKMNTTKDVAFNFFNGVRDVY